MVAEVVEQLHTDNMTEQVQEVDMDNKAAGREGHNMEMVVVPELVVIRNQLFWLLVKYLEKEFGKPEKDRTSTTFSLEVKYGQISFWERISSFYFGYWQAENYSRVDTHHLPSQPSTVL